MGFIYFIICFYSLINFKFFYWCIFNFWKCASFSFLWSYGTILLGNVQIRLRFLNVIANQCSWSEWILIFIQIYSLVFHETHPTSHMNSSEVGRTNSVLLLFNWRICLRRMNDHTSHIIICTCKHNLFTCFTHCRGRAFYIIL